MVLRRKSTPPGAPDPKRTLKTLAGSDAAAAPEKDPFQRVIHERMRLAIVGALAVNDTLTFSELKDLLDTSDGNLSVHTQKLEVAGYVESMKTFENRTPKTEYRLTPRGRAALENYLAHMESLIQVVREEKKPR